MLQAAIQFILLDFIISSKTILSFESQFISFQIYLADVKGENWYSSMERGFRKIENGVCIISNLEANRSYFAALDNSLDSSFPLESFLDEKPSSYQ